MFSIACLRIAPLRSEPDTSKNVAGVREMNKRPRWMTAVIEATEDRRVPMPWERGLRRTAMMGRRAPVQLSNVWAPLAPAR